ncbi:hypothetical protein RRF57_005865 [Xylaria bambusicola]|uniref:Uncharacterized protein n=1 Tax=Xylaria bambusicola TaxID=326684 RepID=A0AAN7UDC1_9PEZI
MELDRAARDPWNNIYIHPSDALARPHEPPHSSPSSSAADSRRPAITKGLQHYHGLPVLDYRQCSSEMFELSADGTTIVSKATYPSENGKAVS